MKIKIILILFVFSFFHDKLCSQTARPTLNYIVSMTEAQQHKYHMEVHAARFNKDSLVFKMPNWMPGYYQIMDYANDIENISAKDQYGKSILIKKFNHNSWSIIGIKNKPFTLSYDIKANKQFVAISYIDSTHAYIVPENNFLYVEGYLNLPVKVRILNNPKWNKIATGLETIPGKLNEFSAPDFDVLYDCPILVGNLEELPSFKVDGIEHRFIAYQMGNFDKPLFVSNLKKIVETAVKIFNDIPYKQFTFLGIGPGMGGIEHLNNTTLSFNGNEIKTTKDMNRMMNFIAHEYFHHYNVKRIRPYELGPFDYDKENKTNQLWVSEGLTVYYEYMIARRSGLADEQTFISNFEENINAVENNPGRLFQSLSQASYNTWDDGPFGTNGEEAGKTISYYDKGPVIGLLLDFAIRNASKNQKSLDDVMRLLYAHYCKNLQRGFTDAEFQQACELIAGISLSQIFEYVYTTKELDYSKYLNYAGLKLEMQPKTENNKETKIFKILKQEKLDSLQWSIQKSWLNE
jgi:predicted metalloprotease with PDZ domain